MRRIPGDRSWPAWSDELAVKAMRRVADLAPDLRLRAMLAAEANVYARREWDQWMLAHALETGAPKD